ncbi:MAG: ribosome biogenesis GTP-binding protein YihA/YsxC [Faecalibacterium sp.]|nr:ribosome biogenesis GTP-binding protein YihA/YsxC [Ruminococcus sp.]MCM1391644.1 ribosome biogenesis GTP-binding protein YihA/YsxC [Ruminococcus sp.]MCM1485747.1 ribosome biogenesis GTP-binding protein YihA/YsxC [Faecalibacterium sp.]
MRFDNAVFETSYGTVDQLTESTLPEIAFSGRSNVGKSSLLNRLLGRKSLARVSSTPGKTVTINMFKLDACRFVDLPGYGYAKVSNSEKLRWANLMESYFSSGRDIRLVVQLIDMRHAPTAQDIEMIEYMRANNIPFIVAMTKCDKLNKTERMNQLMSICEVLTKYGNISAVPFSATIGEGADEIRCLIENAVNG